MTAGDNILQAGPDCTSKLSNGVYYYFITAVNKDGLSCRSKNGLFVIIR
jgi:hypothetical protein